MARKFKFSESVYGAFDELKMIYEQLKKRHLNNFIQMPYFFNQTW